MSAVALIQARMGSERFPGKVMRALGGRPVLGWVVRAAEASGACSMVVVCTSVSPDDDPIAEWADSEGVAFTRGSLDDVLGRYLEALDLYPADAVVRLTGDCPLLDPAVIAAAVAAFDSADVDYLSTVAPRSLPRGLDVEIMAASALRRSAEQATGVHRSHVTSHLRDDPVRFPAAGLVFRPPADDLRVTLDEPDDGRLLDAVVAEIGDRAPGWREVVALLRSRPDLVELNRHVRQKELSEG